MQPTESLNPAKIHPEIPEPFLRVFCISVMNVQVIWRYTSVSGIQAG